MSMMPLYSQLHKSGLVAVGVSMDPKASRIDAALDDVTLPWPQIADQDGLAAHYHVDPQSRRNVRIGCFPPGGGGWSDGTGDREGRSAVAGRALRPRHTLCQR